MARRRRRGNPGPGPGRGGGMSWLSFLCEPLARQPVPEGRAEAEDVVVEVVAGVVQVDAGLAALAVADEAVGARHLLEHEAEVLRGHRRQHVVMRIGLADGA